MKVFTAIFSLILALLITQDANARSTALQAPAGANVKALFQSNMQQSSGWARNRGVRCSDDDMNADIEAIKEEMRMKIQMLMQELEEKLSDPNLSPNAMTQIIEEFKQKIMMVKEEYKERLEQAGMIMNGRTIRCNQSAGSADISGEQKEITQDFKNQAKAYFIETRTELTNPSLTLDEMEVILQEYEADIANLFASFDNASFLQQHHDMYIESMRNYYERIVDVYTNGGSNQNGGSHQGGVSLRDQL